MDKSLDIRTKDLLIVQNILKKNLPENAKAWVFGSRARGKARRASDLDLAIDLGRPFTKMETSKLFHAFEESDLPYKVDVVDLHSVNETLKIIIENERIRL